MQPTITLHAILRAAQRRALMTVESLRQALHEADAEHTSTGYVGELLKGRREWSLWEADVALGHVGTRGLAETLAAIEGGVVSWPGDTSGEDLPAEGVHLTHEASGLAESIVTAGSPSSPGGREYTDAEWQAMVARAEAVHARLGHILPRLRARRVA